MLSVACLQDAGFELKSAVEFLLCLSGFSTIKVLCLELSLTFFRPTMGWTQCAGNHDIIITDTDLNKSPASWPLSAYSRILHLKEESALYFYKPLSQGWLENANFYKCFQNKYTLGFLGGHIVISQMCPGKHRCSAKTKYDKNVKYKLHIY